AGCTYRAIGSDYLARARWPYHSSPRLADQLTIAHDDPAADDGGHRLALGPVALERIGVVLPMHSRGIDDTLAFAIDDCQIAIGAHLQRTLARVQAPRPSRALRRGPHVLRQRHLAHVHAIGHEQSHTGLDAGEPGDGFPDVRASLLVQRVRRMVGCDTRHA